MSIDISRYSLKFKQTGKERRGFLIRVKSQSGSVGYADCHPWVEFGDASLAEQEKSIRDRKLTPLLTRSLHFAAIDAAGRRSGIHLFNKKEIPASHVLSTLQLLPSQLKKIEEWGVTCIKLKIQKQDAAELLKVASQLPPHMRLRLDFNAHFSYDECRNFLKAIQPIKNKIDFIEDPMPFDLDKWLLLEKDFGIQMASDFETSEAPHPFIEIHKPAVQSAPQTKNRLIVTAYLDHPIGQLSAAYTALQLPAAKHEIGGWLPHPMYEENDFSKQLGIKNGRIVPPPGTGFGFDDLLASLQWERLI